MSKFSLQMVPISEINVVNPRDRDKLIAESIRQNILKVGLKRPITVTPSKHPESGKKYDLICGQGRLEAFQALGATEIPAVIMNVTREDALLMGLVENVARRRSNGIELINSLKYLREQGYTEEDISLKTDLTLGYVKDIFKLIDNGEQYLLKAVEKGNLPLYLAISIATEEDADVQIALTKAFESGQISGTDLIRMQKMIVRRKRYGRALTVPREKRTRVASQKILAQYQRNAKEKKFLIAQLNYVKSNISIAAAAFGKLLNDLHFTNQLHAAGLHEIPALVVKLAKEGHNGNQVCVSE